MPNPAPRSRIYAIANDYVEAVAEQNPLAATSMGVPGHDHEMTDFSPDGIDRRAALDSRTLADLRAATVIDESDRIARDVILERLELSAELHDAGEPLRDLNILHSPMQAIRSSFDLMPRAEREDWRHIAQRLRRVPDGLLGVRETLDHGLSHGLAAAARQTTGCAQQAEVWSGQQEGQAPFFDSLLEAYEAVGIQDASLADDLRDAATTASQAYADHARYLTEQY
ncbi:MAG TPA: DUF885 family protein, partial [Dehalococcoidia bacterium]|nr:DUF885 family protein [Dehalococcoidia bacterium]